MGVTAGPRDVAATPAFAEALSKLGYFFLRGDFILRALVLVFVVRALPLPGIPRGIVASPL